MMVLTFGVCATAEVAVRAASDKAVMRVFMAGLHLGCRDWLSNNVTVGRFVEIERDAVHNHRNS